MRILTEIVMGEKTNLNVFLQKVTESEESRACDPSKFATVQCCGGGGVQDARRSLATATAQRGNSPAQTLALFTSLSTVTCQSDTEDK